MYVYNLWEGWTDWAEIFLLTPSWPGKVFGKKYSDPFISSSEIRKKSAFITVYIYRYTIQDVWILWNGKPIELKIRGNLSLSLWIGLGQKFSRSIDQGMDPVFV